MEILENVLKKEIHKNFNKKIALQLNNDDDYLIHGII